MEQNVEREVREGRLKKKKQKKRLTLAGLFGGVCILGAAYYGLGKYQEYRAEQEAVKQETAGYALFEFEPEEVASYTLTNSDYTITLVQKGEEWDCDAETERSVNQETAAGLVSSFCQLTSSKIAAETTEKAADFGLDEPQATWTAVLQDGTEYTLSLGNEAQTGSGYYCSSSDREEIYLVDSSVYNTLTKVYDDFWEETEDAEETAVGTEEQE